MPRLNLVQERFIDTSLNIFCELIFFTTVLFIDTILMKTMLIQYCNRLNRRNDIYIYIYQLFSFKFTYYFSSVIFIIDSKNAL